MQGQFAVGEGVVDGFGDFRHALQDRRNPARRQRVELHTGETLLQPDKQRLRHHRVADPGRSDDQRTMGGGMRRSGHLA